MNRQSHALGHCFCVVNCLSLVLLGVGCTGEVNLGGAVVGSAPEATTVDVELAAATANLMKLKALAINGLVADQENLYLMTLAGQGSDGYYLQRCNKSDCWPSLTSISRVGWPTSDISYNVGSLGWVAEGGYELCHAPNCEDRQVIDGAMCSRGSQSPFAWDEQFLYWRETNDSAIYRCEISSCSAKTSLVASVAGAETMTLLGDELYWLEWDGGVLRARTDGSVPPERLMLGESPSWVPRDSVPATANEYDVRLLALDGGALYVARGNVPLFPSTGCVDCTLERLSSDGSGVVRETLLQADGDFDAVTYMTVFDGELVWSSDTGNLWSCRTEDCSASKRQLGIAGNTGLVVMDDESVYWLSALCSAPGNCEETWNLKRTPRIAH